MEKVYLSQVFKCEFPYVLEVEYILNCPVTHEYFGFSSLQSALDYSSIIKRLYVVSRTNIIRTDHV